MDIDTLTLASRSKLDMHLYHGLCVCLRKNIPGLIPKIIMSTLFCAVFQVFVFYAPGAVAGTQEFASVSPDIEVLRGDLRDSSNPFRRFAALETLSKMGPEAAPLIDDVLKLWRDPEPWVARRAVASVVEIGDSTVPALTAMLEAKGASQANRLNAVHALLAIGKDNGNIDQAFPTLLPMMRLGDHELRLTANTTFQYMRDIGGKIWEYAPPLLNEIQGSTRIDDLRAQRILLLLMTLTEPGRNTPNLDLTISVLRHAVHSQRSDIRALAVTALGQLDEAAAPAIPDLVGAVDDDVYDVHRRALETLENMGEPALPSFSKMLLSSDVSLVRFACEAIARQGDRADTQVPDLVALLSHQDPEVRLLAVKSLGQIGSAAQLAAPKLVELLAESQALTMRLAAVDALGSIGSAANERLAAMIKGAAATNPEERLAAEQGLQDAALAIEARIAQLMPLVAKSGDNPVPLRAAAINAVGRILLESGQALSALTETKDASPARVAARQAQMHLVARVQPMLLAALDEGRDPAIQVAAAEAINGSWAMANTAIPALERHFSDSNRDVRDIVMQGIGSFDKNEALKYLNPNYDKEVAAIDPSYLQLLYRLRPIPDSFVAMLGRVIKKGKNPEMIPYAVNLLADLGKGGADVVPQLVECLDLDQGPDGPMRGGNNGLVYTCAQTLGRIGVPAAPAIPALTKLLREAGDGTDATVTGLAQIGTKRVRAEDLSARRSTEDKERIQQLKDKVRQIQRLNDVAVKSLAQISDKLVDAKDFSALSSLEDAVERIHILQLTTDDAIDLERNVEYMQLASWEAFQAKWKGRIEAHPVISTAIPLYLLWVSGLLLALWLSPLALLKINRVLTPLDIRLPGWLGGISLPARYLLIVGFLNYRPAVLDAWVTAHIDSVRERFLEKKTVHDRETHIPVPVELNQRVVPHLSVTSLQPTFERQIGCLLIWGEGGSGKTSLACSIARSAMDEDVDRRLCRHLTIPILVEHEHIFQEGGDHTLREAISQQLQDLGDEADPIPDGLLDQLLRQRRILVIIDHLSEMSEETRAQILAQIGGFEARALIITSRLDESLGGITKTTVKPLRIAGNRLSSFMEAYLIHRGKRELFADTEFFDACSRLSSMVGDRDITPLFAKLFAEEMIRAKKNITAQALPENIPDLMLSYVNELNAGVTEEAYNDRAVHEDVMVIAWECLRETFRPAPAPLGSTLAALSADDPGARLAYLSDRLHLIQLTQPDQDHVSFLLDPLAEYFAAMYLVEHFGEDEAWWRSFLEQAGQMHGAPLAIRGFMLAVRDCCLSSRKATETMQFVAQEIGRYVAV